MEGATSSDLSSHRWLLRFVLGIATLVFMGRAAPMAFLPLVLKDEFGQSDSVIGVLMAVYPLVALMTTPWAARLSRRTKRIIALHSVAIITVAFAMLLTSLAVLIRDMCGDVFGVLWVALCRAVQGMGVSLYLSSNTSLITRKFPKHLPYVIGMIEVAVGSGSQLGRLAGGFLYDLGGFTLPLVMIGFFQVTAGLLGVGFEDAEQSDAQSASGGGGGDGPRESEQRPKQDPATLPWSTLITPRLCVGGLSTFVMYFLGCALDATLLQYLDVHLAPVSVGTLSIAMSTRGLSYLLGSLVIAQVMHRQLVSFERLITFGAFLYFFGLLIMAPQPLVVALEGWVFTEEVAQSRPALWSTQIAAFVFASGGGALMFVPSLPLMQSEVQSHGSHAVEQVAELFVTMMTLGEMLGPIIGGWLVERFGFAQATLMLAAQFLPLIVLALVTYDHAVVRARRNLERQELSQQLVESDDDGIPVFGLSCGPRCAAMVPSDGEAAFAWRRIPFALEEKRAGETAVPSSAPSSIYRRKYPGKAEPKGSMTAPSRTFRRVYESPPPRRA